MENKQKIIISTIIKARHEVVWEKFIEPKHIVNWYHASDNWHTPYANNDLRVGGRFLYRMEAKDGSFGFDYGGIYNEIKLHESISYTLDDGRSVKITFLNQNNETKVIETFDAEDINPIEMQQAGWQMILDNFKRYTESI